MADHRFVAVQEHGHRGCVFTSTLAFSYIVPRLIQCINGGSVPRNRAIAWPACPTNTWPSGGRATTLPHNHAAAQRGFVRGRPARGPRAALQLPLRRSSTSQRWRRPRPRGSASAGAGTGLPTGPTRTLSPLASARPAPCLRRLSARIGPARTLSLLASARPAMGRRGQGGLHQYNLRYR